jgi:integrase/recombinase XerD
MKNIVIETRDIGNIRHLIVRFSYDPRIIQELRSIGGGRWDPEQKYWYFRYSPKIFNELQMRLGKYGEPDISDAKNVLKFKNRKPLEKLNSGDEQKLDNFKNYLVHRRMSSSTISTYLYSIRRFFEFIKPTEIKDACEEDLIRYVHEYIIPNGYSFAFQNQTVSACKLFFTKIMKTQFQVEKLERPRREHKLPNVLSKEEVEKILKAPTNLKHRVALRLIYACGLRRGELLKLRITDIDSNRKIIKIVGAKGNKDRIVPLPEILLQQIREYYVTYKPKKWLIEGQRPNQQYSAASLSSVLRNAVKKVKINKPVTLHWLRHSFATHLLESGTSIRVIQELLGHKSSKTTEIYTHVSRELIQQIKSPYEDLDL